MGNCKTCVYRKFDPLWTVYKCRLKAIEVQDVDTLDCKEYKKGDPQDCSGYKKPQTKPLTKPSDKPPANAAPGSCDTCIYHRFDPVWVTHTCLLKRIELQNGVITNCKEYLQGKPLDKFKPKKPELGPTIYKVITENGNYKASEEGVTGYNEVNVQVPVEIITNEPYDGKYEVKPTTHERVLPTKDKVMTEHLKVSAIPYYETTNHKNGMTVVIGE